MKTEHLQNGPLVQMTIAKEITITATDRIVEALRQKGYQCLSRFGTDLRGNTTAFIMYTNGKHVLVLQEYKDGSCELYQTVSDSLGIQDTIDKIPELSKEVA